MSDPCRDAMGLVLATYLRARQEERLAKTSRAWQNLMRARDALAAFETVRKRPKLGVRASAGQGAWARIPWIALLHADVTTSTQKGIYVIFLFRADMSGVYLTLNQGVTEPLQKLGRIDGLAEVSRRAAEARGRLGGMASAGFEMTSPIDLRTDYSTGQHYTASTIAHRLYGTNGLPTDRDLEFDVEAVLVGYERICDLTSDR